MAKATCKIDGCSDPVSGRGWCSMHWQRWRNNGDPLIVKRRAKQPAVCEKPDCGNPGYMRGLCLSHYREVQRSERAPCKVEGCDEPWQAHGLCVVHYQRFQRTGSTDPPGEVGRSCSVEGCGGRVRAQEMCEKHYRNMRRHGTPEAPPRPEKVWLPCSEEGCDELATRNNGMCNRHYRKAIANEKPQCRQPGCGRPVRKRGDNCTTHGGWSQDLRRTYSITAEQFEAMKAEQDGRCRICGKLPEDIGSRFTRLVVDHDHKCCPGTTSCGKCVRGLLCSWCNRLIGLASDDPAILLAAVRYLEETKPGQLPLFAA
jgi:hypothetical protein